MTKYEYIKSLDIDSLADFFAKNENSDTTPWDNWFATNYCKHCESVVEEEDGKVACYAFCEVYDRCKYFSDYPDFISEKDAIKLWLKSEHEE